VSDSKEKKSVAVAEIAVPEAKSPELELAQLEQIEYSRVARRLGLYVGAQAEFELLAWLDERGDKIFETAEVEEFLQKRTPEGQVWNWMALRARDMRVDIISRMKSMAGGIITTRGYTNPVYTKRAPLQALNLAAAVDQEFPSTFTFHVSDYEAPRIDPFLAVMAKTSPTRLIVVAHWDEPAFIPKRSE